MKNKKLYKLTECAMLLALATVLSFCKLYEAPLGGAITLASMLPIMFISFRHGVKWGLSCGLIYGVIQLILGLNNLSYVPTVIGVISCVAFDYIVPFTLLGIAGFAWRFNKGTTASKIFVTILGVFTAIVLRFMCHFLVGAVIWYEITKAGEWNDYVFKHGMWIYSFIYNISYLGPDSAIVLVLSPVIVKLKDNPFFDAKQS